MITEIIIAIVFFVILVALLFVAQSQTNLFYLISIIACYLSSISLLTVPFSYAFLDIRIERYIMNPIFVADTIFLLSPTIGVSVFVSWALILFRIDYKIFGLYISEKTTYHKRLYFCLVTTMLLFFLVFGLGTPNFFTFVWIMITTEPIPLTIFVLFILLFILYTYLVFHEKKMGGKWDLIEKRVRGAISRKIKRERRKAK